MKITKIKLLKNIEEDKKNLNKFLSENKSATKTFRYFNKREYDVINNHIYTALYFNNDNILGYGHLDKDNNTVWLGIMVSDKYRGLGIGKKIMTDLLNNYNGEITLSVDKKNISAINLYKSKNFIKIEENNNIIIMKLKK
jgi:ribosomal protein S18 acetylase RimI-like enzyme